MRAIELIYKPALMLLITATLFLIVSNQTVGQEKKKIIRIVEVDEKGEKVVKEINVPEGDKKITIITDGDNVNVDSIDKVIKIRMKDAMGKIDSMCHFWIGSDHGDLAFDHDFDFDFDIPINIDAFPGKHIMLFGNDSLDKSVKMYFREKDFENKKDLEKVLEELENGTFDPKKWDMKEVDKDKMKDYVGKGNVLVVGGKDVKLGTGKGYAFVTDIYTGVDEDNDTEHAIWLSTDSKGENNTKVHFKTIKGKGKPGVVYIMSDEKTDSLNDCKEMIWTVEADAEGDNAEKVIVFSSEGKGPHKKMKVKKTAGSGDEEDIVISVIANDKGRTEIKLSNPTDEEMNMLVKNGFEKKDVSKLLDNSSIYLVVKPDKDKYLIKFKSKETGTVKLVLADEKGKTIKTDKFDHKGDKTEREIEAKDLNPGTYFIQVQINGKTATRKISLEKE